MKKIAAVVVIFLSFACSNNFPYVRATKILAIDPPANLSLNGNCPRYWRNLSESAIDMDKYSKYWNDTMIRSARSLIEEGCVQQKY